MEDNIKLTENKKNENLKKEQKVRNYGIDFIRIIAMYGIVLSHIMYIKKTRKKYRKFKQLKILHIVFFWHNNAFAFISGFVGHKGYKYSNLFYLWMCTSFYSFIIYSFYLAYKPQFIVKDKFYHNLFPIIFKKYWFFTAYFGMYLFLPIINKGIAFLSKSELKNSIINIFVLLVFWHDIMNQNHDIFNTNRGYSLLWLLILYITGGYFGKYQINLVGVKKFNFCLIIFLIYIFISFIFFFIYHKTNNRNEDIKLRNLIILKQLISENYDSIMKVIQSISIIFFLMQINYNKYLGKIISFIGTLTFGVYLIHYNKYIRDDILSKLFDNEKNNISLFSVYKLFITKSLFVFIICIFIDYLRNILFKFFKIRKICIILDKKCLKY